MTVLDELKTWLDELQAVNIGLVGSADLARQHGVDEAHLAELQDVIDNITTAAMDLAAAIRRIELA